MNPRLKPGSQRVELVSPRINLATGNYWQRMKPESGQSRIQNETSELKNGAQESKPSTGQLKSNTGFPKTEKTNNKNQTVKTEPKT